MVDFLHCARECGHHRPHFGDGTDHGDTRSKPRAFEMAGDLVAHDLGLLAHLERERFVAVGGGLVHHHRQRGLERVREIADVGARARDDLAVGVDERVGLARERGDLDRKAAFQPLGGAGADGGQALGDAIERRETEAHLKGRGQQEHHRQHAEGDQQRPVEALGFIVDLGGVARHGDQKTALVAELDDAFEDAQPLLLRSGAITLPCAGGTYRGGRIFEVRQSRIPERTRGTHIGIRSVEPRDLPVPARERQFEQRLAERLGKFVARFVGGGDVGHQRAQIDTEAAVKRAFHRRTVERGQHDSGDDQDHHDPERRREEQAQRKRISAHPSTPSSCPGPGPAFGGPGMNLAPSIHVCCAKA